MRPTTERYDWKLLSECQTVAELQMRLTSLFNFQGTRAFLFSGMPFQMQTLRIVCLRQSIAVRLV